MKKRRASSFQTGRLHPGMSSLVDVVEDRCVHFNTRLKFRLVNRFPWLPDPPSYPVHLATRFPGYPIPLTTRFTRLPGSPALLTGFPWLPGFPGYPVSQGAGDVLSC